MILLPDELQPEVYEAEIAPNLQAGNSRRSHMDLMFTLIK